MKGITAIPAFRDNYIWAWVHDGAAVVVDPGDAAPVRQWLRSAGVGLGDILITHWHPDHIGGVAELVAEHGARVFGPRQEADKLPPLDIALADGDRLHAGGMTFEVLEVPGHTLGHIAYYCAERAVLFCGDTLFHCGCGRLFEGTPEQMHASLARLAALPEATQAYCTHEYTLANLAFARSVEPAHPGLQEAEAEARRLREADTPTVPTSLAHQKAINPFLRTDDPDLQRALAEVTGEAIDSALQCFARLRALKDRA